MPRYRKPRPKQKETNRPSNFFIIALLLGLLLLGLAFWQVASRRSTPANTTTQSSTTR